MNRDTLVSIIIPVHNDFENLESLLVSIEKYLQINFEVVVVDNGSRPKLKEVCAARYWLKWIELENTLFPGTARNIGIKESSGQYIVFLDSDVLITPEWAETIAKFSSNAANFKRLVLAGDQYDIAKNPSWIDINWFYYLRFAVQSHINGGNIITNRKTIELIQGFDESLETGEDYDLCERAKAASCKIEISREWRVHHEGNPSKLSQFIRRERWHGKSDFLSWKRIAASKISLVTLAFIGLHIFLLISLLTLLQFGSELAALFAGVGLLLIITMSAARVLRDVGIHSVKQVICSMVISYFYFVGRSFSAFDIVKAKLIALSLVLKSNYLPSKN